jgi:hypothetical protein
MSTRNVLAAAVSLVAVLSGLPSAPAARADECHTFHGFTVCGAALNKTRNTMYAARIADEAGARPCTVRDTQGHVLSRTDTCVGRAVSPGRTSPYRDTDAIMFKRTFRINGHPFKSGEWVKIRVGVVCVSPLKQIQPQCFGM